MGKITIESSTAAKLYLNKKELGKIKRETKEFEIENGEHEIYAKAAWCGSPKVKINVYDDETLTLTLNSFKYEAVFKAIFMALSGLLVVTKNLIFAVLAGIVIIYPLYCITIGKDKYLEFFIKK